MSRKLYLQTLLLSVAVIINWIFGFTKDDYNFGHLYFLLWYYSYFIFLVFMPLTLFYFTSKTNKIILGRFFRAFGWLFILVFLATAGLDFYLTTLDSFNLTVLREFGIINLLAELMPYLVYLTLILLMLGAIKVNRQYEKQLG